MKFRSTIILLLFGLSATAWAQTAPWQQHGPLRAAENGHFIEHEDGTPFLWVGDTAWAMFQQLTREQVDKYLDNRQKLGFTVIQAVAHWSPHGGGLARSPNNAPNAYGHRPFTGDERSPDTSKPLVQPGGNSLEPNDYWDNADYVVEAVRKRNMYLALLPCWGSELITVASEYTPIEAKTFGSFLGNRYRKEPHIIWVLGGDTKAQFRGFDKNQKFKSFDNRQIFRSMAEGLAEGVTGRTVRWDKPDPAWGEVFMTYHPDGDAAFNSSNWFHSDPWLDANGIEVWKEVDLVYRTVLNDYELDKPAKPTLFLEGSYEYGTYRHECGWVTPVRVRRQFYQTFFAGGAGHTYGAGPIWAMRGDGGDYNCGYTWEQALDFPGAKQVASIGSKFLRDNKWTQWIPNGNVISSVGEGESFKAATVSADRETALVYFSNNSSTKVTNILEKNASAYWFYPRDGQLRTAQQFAQNEARDMIPPDNWEDAILVLKTIK